MELTVAEIAAKLRVSRWSVRRLIESGELAAIPRGRLLVVPVSSYAKFIRRNTVPARTPQGATR